jgi:hypothetical protein
MEQKNTASGVTTSLRLRCYIRSQEYNRQVWFPLKKQLAEEQE